VDETLAQLDLEQIENGDTVGISAVTSTTIEAL
jgi:hypothetical protein